MATTTRLKFTDLVKKMSPARQARHAAHLARLLEAKSLRELRKSRNVTQQALAKSMDTTQGEVSKIEQRSDWHVSTLREYVEAMGGELEFVARFDDGSAVTISPSSQDDLSESAK